MTTTQGVTQQVAHSMTTQGTIPFRGFSPPGGPFRGGAPSHGKVSVMNTQSDHWLLTGGCHWSCGPIGSDTHVWQSMGKGAMPYSSSGVLGDVPSILESQQQNLVNSYFPVFIVTWVWPRSHRKRKLGCFTKTPPTTVRYSQRVGSSHVGRCVIHWFNTKYIVHCLLK